jgi:hypothetical protein
VVELKIPQVPPEMTHELAVTFLGTMSSTILKSIVDKFGSKEAQKMIYPHLKEMGKQMAAMAPGMGITGKDAIAIASVIHFSEKQLFKIKGEPIEVAPNRVVKEITRCPLQSLSLDYCLAFQGIADGVIEKINPEYKWTLTKVIPKGDHVCQWIVEKK